MSEVGSPIVGPTSSSVRLHINVPSARHIYNLNIADCDVKKTIYTTLG